jgi:hypothetical protein
MSVANILKPATLVVLGLLTLAPAATARPVQGGVGDSLLCRLLPAFGWKAGCSPDPGGQGIRPKNGCSLDPGGNGCSIDPNGGYAPAKNGCSIDPDGRCAPAKNGCSLDPNGLCQPK